MKVLVVGGAGYVGGAVTDLLLMTSHDFRVYDALLYEESYRKPVEFVYGDVRDTDRLKPHLRWADAVIWLAALVGDGACALNPDISDAISTSMLEAMAMGSFPIQSWTSCADEWVKDGHSALLVPPNDAEPIAAAIRRAVTDDGLVNAAAETNWATARARLDAQTIKPQVVSLYRRLLGLESQGAERSPC